VPDQPPRDPDDFDDFDDDDDLDDLERGFDGDFDFDLHGDALPLDDHESAMVQQDLVDLESFEETFRSDGYRGVSVYCQDCEVEHYYPWELLRENLRLLLETGETPVHEPAFDPNPADYVPWEYARGYVDALSDAGVASRRPVDACPTCGLRLPGDFGNANFCPRCAAPLMGARLVAALRARGLSEDDVQAMLHEVGLPG
jgi:RNase P subunit RPR2